MAAQARHVDMWVAEGIISRDQAESICEFERRVTSSRVTASEALAYSGAAVAAGVAVTLTADSWPEIGILTRVSVMGLIAVSLLFVGILSARDASSTVRRFGQTALLLAVPATGITVGIAIEAWVGAKTSILVGSVTALTTAIPMYTWRRSGPQNVGLFLAILSAGLFLSMYPLETVPTALPGTVVFSVGAAWVVASGAGWIVPRFTGEIMGAVASLIGSMMLLVGLETGVAFSLVVAVAVSVGTVAYGVTHSRVVLTVVGVVALASYVPWLTSEILSPTIGAPFTLVAVAMTFALWATRRPRKRTHRK